MWAQKIGLLAEAIIELLVYDLRSQVLGFRSAYDSARTWPLLRRPKDRNVALERDIQAAVDHCCCLYVKPVRCLQRSIVSARMMRRRGMQPIVRIGYRMDPFFSHAWLEIGGEVVGDSRAYQRKLKIIDAI